MVREEEEEAEEVVEAVAGRRCELVGVEERRGRVRRVRYARNTVSAPVAMVLVMTLEESSPRAAR